VADDDGFLARWSQRKAQQRRGTVAPEAPPPAVDVAAAPEPLPVAPLAQESEVPAAPPPPTLEDVERLAPGDGIARFVGADVDRGVKHAALKKLFADPHYNVMDRLDTYIDDYGQPDPLPPALLRLMTQSRFLGLDAEPAPPTECPTALPDEDADLRLQPNDAAGCAGPGPDAGADAGRDV
jgi:hypothetical protein